MFLIDLGGGADHHTIVVRSAAPEAEVIQGGWDREALLAAEMARCHVEPTPDFGRRETRISQDAQPIGEVALAS